MRNGGLCSQSLSDLVERARSRNLLRRPKQLQRRSRPNGGGNRVRRSSAEPPCRDRWPRRRFQWHCVQCDVRNVHYRGESTLPAPARAPPGCPTDAAGKRRRTIGRWGRQRRRPAFKKVLARVRRRRGLGCLRVGCRLRSVTGSTWSYCPERLLDAGEIERLLLDRRQPGQHGERIARQDGNGDAVSRHRREIGQPHSNSFG